MIKKKILISLLATTLIFIIAIGVTFYSGNRGVYPIDTFTFYDTGFLILQNYHPVKDYWIISGITGDYIQALLFKIFGVNWNVYLLHAGLINSFTTFFLFKFLQKYKLNLNESLFFSISFAILSYPVSGTPFTYLESYNLSLVSIFIFFLGIITNKYYYFFILPFLMVLSFLSMQLPSGLVNIILIFGIFLSFIIFNKSYKNLLAFCIGSITTLLIFFLYLIILKISFYDFLLQYILFPLSFGSKRILSDPNAFESARLLNKFNFKNILLDFKYLYFFLIPFFLLIFLNFIQNSKNLLKFLKENFIDIMIVLFTLSIIFHQLITANQIFIFSLASILGAFLYRKIEFMFSKKNFFKTIIIFLIIFSTIKFHYRYNVDRKFMELQNLDINKESVDASSLDTSFNSLKWINPAFRDSPNNEIQYLVEVKNDLLKSKEPKMVVSHYQFFSILTKEDLNIPNRWYFPNNTFPSSADNFYYKDYVNFIKKKITNKKIKEIFIIMEEGKETWVKIYSNILGKNCIEIKEINYIAAKLNITKCYNSSIYLK